MHLGWIKPATPRIYYILLTPTFKVSNITQGGAEIISSSALVVFVFDNMLALNNMFALSTACRCSASLADAMRGAEPWLLAHVVTMFSNMFAFGKMFVFDNMFVFDIPGIIKHETSTKQ